MQALGIVRPAGDLPDAAILDAIPHPAALVDGDGAILHANPPLRDVAGPLLPIPPGLPLLLLLHPDARAGASAWFAGPAPEPHEATLANPAPTEVRLRLSPLPERHRLLLLDDLTEQARRRAEAEAGECLRTIGQLAGGIAHDVNNLLSIIVASAEEARTLAPETELPLRPALDAAARGAALVRRLLAFARRQQLEPRVVDLDEVVGLVVPMLRSLLGNRVVLEWRPGALGRRVRVDPVQLDQVLLNLATNARTAMVESGGEGTPHRLTVATDTAVALREEPGFPDTLPPGRWAVLDVTDTGPGIPESLLPRVFEPFFTTRGAEGGTGLGLATVHGIVRQSGGALHLDSRPGRTRFRIHLPRHDGEPEPARPAPAATAPAGPRHVLLVDDEAPLRRLAAVALERAGLKVTQAEDGDEALEMLEHGLLPHALVSDIAMPGLDGLALARAARSRRPDLPILLVSGYAEAALGTDMAADGIAFLPKPYRPAQLVEAVAALS